MTAETFAATIGTILLIYIGCGFLFAVAFLTQGITKTDEATHGSSWRFKLIIAPGVVGLWPVLLKKWLRTKKDFINPAEE